MMLLESASVPGLVWMAAATYLVVAGLVVLGTDFRAPRDNPGAQLVICMVALVFAAAWPLRAMRRMLRRSA